MSKLKFSDGVEIETGGELRALELTDGWYVVGEGLLTAAKDKADAERVIAELRTKLQFGEDWACAALWLECGHSVDDDCQCS